jgi:hypothetical protein
MDKKQLFDLRADVAVMIILREFGVEAYGALERSQMVKSWPEYGLRDADLPAALARLALRGHVHIVNAADGDQVILTERGAQWVESLPAWLEYQLIVPRRAAYQYRLLPGIGTTRPLSDRRTRRAQRYAVAA